MDGFAVRSVLDWKRRVQFVFETFAELHSWITWIPYAHIGFSKSLNILVVQLAI